MPALSGLSSPLALLLNLPSNSTTRFTPGHGPFVCFYAQPCMSPYPCVSTIKFTLRTLTLNVSLGLLLFHPVKQSNFMEYQSSSMQLKHTKRLCLKTDHLQLLRMQWSRDGSWPAARPSCPCGIVGPTNQRSGKK